MQKFDFYMMLDYDVLLKHLLLVLDLFRFSEIFFCKEKDLICKYRELSLFFGKLAMASLPCFKS